MPSNRKLPDIAPCPCGRGCLTAYGEVARGDCEPKWRVVAACGFEGPVRNTKRTAREAWNRRASEPVDREKLMRDGAMAAAKWFRNWCEQNPGSSLGFPDVALTNAISRGEVIPAREAKPKRLPKAKRVRR